jgi:ArsR family transcriptional regulator, arsenate/arsenite/antimonite-responsive transcriptional repressor / arsenate reductase (thioredoxin)
MDAERNAEVVRRARTHAALADPGRLRIVDELGLGDLTPTELQAMLDMSSNLLAHHVRTLESAGLVCRRRSEADRRRTYLQLVPSALDGLLATTTVSAPRVVFVCTANSARSQLAAAIWQQVSEVPADSAGTDPAPGVAGGAAAVARRHGLALLREPQGLDDVRRDADLVVTVCDRAREEISPRAGTPFVHWSVSDPVPAGTRAAFEAAYADLARRVSDLAPRVTPP